MESNGPIIAARDLYRTFETVDGPLQVIRGVSFELNRGEMSAVTGPSGVGKSTLLHLLGGLDKPTSGEVMIGSTCITGKSEADLARFRNKRLGFVFQYHYLLDDFDAAENIMIPLIMAGLTRTQARQKAEHLLAEIGLKDRGSHRPRELSGGEQQRIAVARALANDPELVLADEPSGNLDAATGRSLHDLLRRINREKSISFLIATHNRELADECDREYLMKDGKLSE